MQIFVFIPFQGHDTTATALQFTFMLLANNPDAQVDSVVVKINIINYLNYSLFFQLST